jgi:hypothetical protein
VLYFYSIKLKTSTMTQVIVTAPATSKHAFRTYRFATPEAARLFIAQYKLEDKVIDIL